MEWDLALLYKADEKAVEDSNKAVGKAGKILEKWSRRIKPDISFEEVKKLLEDVEQVLWLSMKSLQYASLRFSKNVEDTSNQRLYGLMSSNQAKVEEAIAVLRAKIASLPEEKLRELAESIPEYRHVLEKAIREKKHVLSEEAEKVLAALSVSRRDAVAELYEKMTASYTFEIDGKKMTGDEVRALRHSKDGDLRKRAMKVFFERYAQDKLIIEGLYNIVVKDWDTEARLRGYEKPISMRNLENEVDDAAVQRLIDVTTSNTNLVADYYKWKSEYMGEELTLADIYAPIGEENKIDFEEAKEIVLEAYYNFSEKVGDIVKSFFDEKRIDVFPAKGKRGGAFCSYYVPNGKPFVLLNFTGKLRDVSTLAHELGHGIHGTLSSKQNLLNYHTPLTMAEVASVFGEFLVFDLLKERLSGEEKRALIASTIEDLFATMFRQNMFARFEIKAHDRITENGYASYDELSEIYFQELEVMFKDSVKITEEYHQEWSTIPHIFFAPFYVYAYNFANALVIALYEKYLEEGKSFVPRYLQLLESGGNDFPEKLLEKVGVDLRDENFWQRAFDFIGKLIEEVRV